MRQKFRLLIAVCIGVTLMPSCADDQQLVSIAVVPTTETFGAANIPVSADAGAQVQLRALGSYIHPPVTKDITNQVQWFSNTPQMVTVNSTGLITVTGLACGGTLISATVKTNSSTGGRSSSGAIVTGSMTANVVCFTSGAGGSGTSVLTVTFAGLGSGSITTAPSNFTCTSNPCNLSFTSGTNVTLTATPNAGSTFGSWGGCDAVNGQQCTVNNLTANRTVTITFN